MGLQLYNTFTRRLESLKPLAPPSVGLYACGPTVYDEPHLGHLRSAFVFDVLRRYLTHRGFQVRFVRNVTDVDDKIIDKARKDGGPADLKQRCQDVATKYLRRYHEALATLGIEPPTVEPKATEHVVPEMTDLIAKLLMDGIAYEAGGDVYFAVRKFAGYGRLSNRTLDELHAGARIDPGEQKRDPLDFALWKSAKPEEPSWESPWGPGRPGWHIECSVMSGKYLGDAFDIHGGGLDLIFPHHENEIAQSRAAGRAFASCWVHHGLVTVDNEKMSKSLNNFTTVETALETCGGQADALKAWLLGTQYRSPLDYSAAQLKAAEQRLKNWLRVFDLATSRPAVVGDLSDAQRRFEDAMDDDLNTPKALAVLDAVANAAVRDVSLAPAGRAFLSAHGGVLGLFADAASVAVPADVDHLVQQREQARKAKDFKTADRLRQDVAAKGFLIEDTAKGPLVLPKR